MSSNLSAVRCTEDEVYMRAANGVEWSITRAEIDAIYAAKEGDDVSRKAATVADVFALAVETLGDYFDPVGADLAFDPPGSLSRGLNPDRGLLLSL